MHIGYVYIFIVSVSCVSFLYMAFIHFFLKGMFLFFRFFWRFNLLHFSFTKPTYFFLYSYLSLHNFLHIFKFLLLTCKLFSLMSLQLPHAVLSYQYHFIYFSFFISFCSSLSFLGLSIPNLL
ncbi:hypothetical protein DFH27DRAFT_168828 [Peziza echinospora]|nr:hypothetical protein DFH27DRAFT_168828 [Peziza echinospora]